MSLNAKITGLKFYQGQNDRDTGTQKAICR